MKVFGNGKVRGGARGLGVCLCIGFVSVAHAQPTCVERQWAVEFDGPPPLAPSKAALAVTTTQDGVSFVTGAYSVPGEESTRFSIWRVEANGTIPWRHDVPTGNSADYGVAIALNNFSTVLFASGVTNSPSSGKDIVTVAINALTGTPLWGPVVYDNPAASKDDLPVRIHFEPSQGDPSSSELYVAGDSGGVVGPGYSSGADFVVLKYLAATGAPAPGWAVPFRYDGPASGDDNLADMGFAGFTSFVFLLGTSVGIETGNDYALVRINPNDPLDSISVHHNTGFNGIEIATSLAIKDTNLLTGAVFATGYSTGNSLNNYDYLTIRYPLDFTGVPVVAWFTPSTNNGNDIARKIAFASFSPFGGGTGSVIVTGSPYRGSTNRNDFATLMYDSVTLTPIWSQYPDFAARFNHPASGDDRAFDLVVDKNSNSYVTGRAFNGTTYDMAAISYLANGNSRWTALPPDTLDFVIYNGTGNGTDTSGAVGVTASGGPIDHIGNVFLFGTVLARVGTTTVSKYGLLKYIQTDLDQCPP